MYLPVQQRAPIVKRSGSSPGRSIFVICAATIIGSLSVLIILFFTLRSLRQQNYRPKYLPGKFLKEKWTQWRPGLSYGQVPNQPSPAQPGSQNTAYRSPTAGAADGGTEMNTTAANALNRDTSVRSIITLPAYSSSPKPTEQIIAREGERAGMDSVVEFPETAEEEESRREEMMASLYQIRLQRRQEHLERNARRQARRDARAAGNTTRLEQLRAESQAHRGRRDRSASAGGSGGVSETVQRSASTLLREHTAHTGDGRISSVNYAALGCVRHDGSRVRGNSAESDSRPLLDATAPLGGHHSRDDSISSLMSAESVSDMDSAPPSHPQSARQSTSGPEDGDVGARSIPPPPDYEHLEWGEAPAYENRSPEGERPASSLRLPDVAPLPAIQIDVASPLSPSPVSPPSTTTPNTPANAGTETTAREHELDSDGASGSAGPEPERERASTSH